MNAPAKIIRLAGSPGRMPGPIEARHGIPVQELKQAAINAFLRPATDSEKWNKILLEGDFFNRVGFYDAGEGHFLVSRRQALRMFEGMDKLIQDRWDAYHVEPGDFISALAGQQLLIEEGAPKNMLVMDLMYKVWSGIITEFGANFQDYKDYGLLGRLRAEYPRFGQATLARMLWLGRQFPDLKIFYELSRPIEKDYFSTSYGSRHFLDEYALPNFMGFLTAAHTKAKRVPECMLVNQFYHSIFEKPEMIKNQLLFLLMTVGFGFGEIFSHANMRLDSSVRRHLEKTMESISPFAEAVRENRPASLQDFAQKCSGGNFPARFIGADNVGWKFRMFGQSDDVYLAEMAGLNRDPRFGFLQRYAKVLVGAQMDISPKFSESGNVYAVGLPDKLLSDEAAQLALISKALSDHREAIFAQKRGPGFLLHFTDFPDIPCFIPFTGLKGSDRDVLEKSQSGDTVRIAVKDPIRKSEGGRLFIDVIPIRFPTAWERISTDQQYNGRVMNICEFGAFVRLPNGFQGLVSQRNIPVALEECLQRGQEVRVQVNEKKDLEEKISLELLAPTFPKEQYLKPGTIVSGKLRRKTRFLDTPLYFVELGNWGITGLIHPEELGDTQPEDRKFVKAVITGVRNYTPGQDSAPEPRFDFDMDDLQDLDFGFGSLFGGGSRRRSLWEDSRIKVSLSIRRLTIDPKVKKLWEPDASGHAPIQSKYHIGGVFPGKIQSINNGIGMFVELEPGVEGLMHISRGVPQQYLDLLGSRDRVDLRRDPLTTDVKILSINVADRRISLVPPDYEGARKDKRFRDPGTRPDDQGPGFGTKLGDLLKKAQQKKDQK